jgi:signal transduction histidine kinase
MRTPGRWAAPGWPGRQWPVDVLLTVALAAVVIASLLGDNPAVAYPFRAPDGWVVGLGLAASLPLAVRRCWPFTVAAVVTTAVVVIAAARWDPGQTPFCLFLALYTVAAWRELTVAVAGLTVTYAGLGAAALLRTPYFDHPLGWLIVVAVTVAWVMGRVMRGWRSGRENAMARAVQARRARTLAVERAVFAERLRLARELHDVVSHTLSVIAVQSAVARHRFAGQSGPAGPALAAIEQASRAALNDLRRMLGVLRDDRADEDVTTAPAPPPGVAELQPLIQAHRAAHGPVELTVDPAAAAAPQSLRLTVYRLVQEALTNVRKHAPGATATVTVRAEGGTLVVQVDDDGAQHHGGDGYGLMGMRERVSLFGGSLAAGPRDGGGFRVRAVLHVSPEATGEPDTSGRERDDLPEPADAHLPTPAPTSPGVVRESLVDGAVAVALAAFGIADAYVTNPMVAYQYPRPNGWLVALVLLASLPLAVRRRWPVPVFAAAATATFVIALHGWNGEVAGFCSFIALYTVAAWRRLPVATTGLAVLVAADATLAFVGAPNFDYAGELWGAGALLPWGVGLIVRRWRHERTQALARALEAERTRVVAAERAVFAERLRIAREMHDVVSHTLSVIAVQSGVARHQLQPRAHPVVPALAVIEQASRAALDDLRRMLGALRAGTDPQTSLGPSPAVAELELLTSLHRATCGPVELAVDVAARSTPASVQMTVYRLVQEALTNIRKHASGAATRITVHATAGSVTVQVDDDGTRHPDDEDALAGMRERVALFDGSLYAGPGEDGGYRVRAVLHSAGEEPAA